MDTIRETSFSFGSSRLWTPFKDLQAVIEAAIHQKNYDLIPDLEAALKKHKPDFIALLKNPGPNPLHHAAVVKAATEGIPIAGSSGQTRLLSQSHVDEALLISSMLNLDELIALELLIAGEHQQSYFPMSGGEGGMSRGLVAVILYYDGRRTLTNCLRMIVQARPGRTWTIPLHPDLATILTTYTDQLQEQGLIPSILDLIKQFDLGKELDMLQKNRALGPPKYRKQVLDLINECYEFLAETVFCWACQGCLGVEDTRALLSFLTQVQCNNADGSLGTTELYLLMALLYTLDLSPLQYTEPTSLKNAMSLLKYPHLVPLFQKELVNQSGDWATSGIKSITQMAWALSLRILSQSSPSNNLPSEYGDSLEKDEKVIDLAIEGQCFHNLELLAVQSKSFYSEDFFVKQVHELITNFIVLMPLKVKELRANGDEVAKLVLSYQQEGLNPPAQLSRHLEHLFHLISVLYEKDKLDLVEEYWCPVDVALDHKNPKQVTLDKFVRLSSDFLPPPLFVPYINMLASLSNTAKAAHYCYTFLARNGKASPDHSSIISWDHFMASLHRYYQSLRVEGPPMSSAFSQNWPSQQQQARHHLTKGITPQEVAGLQAVLRLITVVVSKNESAGVAFANHPEYSPLLILLGLVSCPIPPELKASLFYALEAFAKLPGLTIHLYQGIEASQILSQSSLPGTRPSGLFMELEEMEARNEEFPITRAMLKLLDTLLEQPIPSGLRIEAYLNYVCSSVLFRFHTRSYRRAAEKWEVCHLCLSVLSKLVCHPDPEPTRRSICYTILSQLLRDSDILRVLLYILHQGVVLLDTYAPIPGQSELESSLLICLKILHSAMIQQDSLLRYLRDSGSSLLLNPLELLLLGVNPSSGKADYLYILLKLVTFNLFLPMLTLMSLRLLKLLCAKDQVNKHLVALFLTNQKNNQVILYGFIETLELEEVQSPGSDPESKWTLTQIKTAAAREVLKLLLVCLEHPSPNFAHFLLGFRMRPPVSKTVLQEPGGEYPRTCLHSVLGILSGQKYGLADLSYRLIYQLCAHRDTSRPMARYLRGQDFFPYHLQLLPFASSQDGKTVDPNVLSQQAWFLRTLALELKVACENQQKSHLQRLLSILLDPRPTTGNVLLSLLGGLDLQQTLYPPFPSCEFLDPQHVLLKLKECEGTGGQVDTRLLRQLLESKATHRTLIAQEIDKVILYVKECNEVRASLEAKAEAFEAWRQLVEVLLLLCPTDIMGPERKAQLACDISLELLDWLLKEEILPELCARGTGVLVTLLSVAYSQCQGNLASHQASLLTILRKILDILTKQGGGHQRVRLNLYSSLLYLLHLLSLEKKLEDKYIYLEHVEMVSSYGDKLKDQVCRDLCTGHTVTRMLAMALLDSLVAHSLDWLHFLISKGYLQHLVDAVATDCLRVQEPSSNESSHHFYLLDSKLALFSRLAQNAAGAQALIHGNVLGKLTLPLLNADTLEPSMVEQVQDACLHLALALGIASTSSETLNQISGFLATHTETLSAALRSPNTPLHRLQLITSLFAILSLYHTLTGEALPSQLRMLYHHQLPLLSSSIEKAQPKDIANILHSLWPSDTQSSSFSSQTLKPELLVQILQHAQLQLNKMDPNKLPPEADLYFYIIEKCMFLIWHIFENRKKYGVTLHPRDMINLFPESFFTRFTSIEHILKKRENNEFLDTMIRRVKKIVTLKTTDTSQTL